MFDRSARDGDLIEGTSKCAIEAAVKNVEDIRNYPRRIAAFTPEAGMVNAELKRFLHANVYSAEALESERRKSAAMIAGMFQFFVENPDQLPAHYREQSQGEPVHRVACDYIAGMTDGFFQRTYKSLGIDGEPAS